jgi:lysyl-tRNA synthetase class 2
LAEEADPLTARRRKLEHLRAAGVDPFGGRYERTHEAGRVVAEFERLEGRSVRLAGRVMGLRSHGRASFADLRDLTGRVQLYARADILGEARYAAFQDLDRGDWIGAEGRVMRTHRGEVSVELTDWVLLCKSLRPLPEKWHGLRDVDLRYRQRYLDLVVNPDVRATFVLRSRITAAIRRWLDARGFLEVETPVLTPVAAGAAARPFVTHHNALDLELYLRIATELHLKRLIVGGLERVYEIGRVFRNEGISTRHNPEFTMLELYQAYADYSDMMELTENLVADVARECRGTARVEYQGRPVDLTPPWQRLSMIDALRRRTGVDVLELPSDEAARNLARRHGVGVEDHATRGQVIDALVDELVLPELTRPTLLTDHPTEISPLARRSRRDPRVTERFEAIVAGMEIANAFSELNDPIDQRERFRQQAAERARGNDEAQAVDEDFILALEYGLPPTGGLGIGIDRLAMILADVPSIRDVILFPTLRPRPSSRDSEHA